MATSIFDDKALMPDENTVAQALDGAAFLWNELQNHVRENYPNIIGEWKFYGKSSGWTFVLKSKKRSLLYFLPNDGFFMVNFVFGDKAVGAAEQAALSDDVLNSIREATPYAEGRPFFVVVKRPEDLEQVKILAKIKFEN